MKTIVIALSLLTLLFAKQKFHVAVLDFETVAMSKSEGRILTNKLRNELVKSGKYVVLDRGEMDAVLSEQGFQQTGCTSSDCAVQMGQILGMSHIISGSIGKIGELFYIETKLIDVETSQIVRSVDTHSKGSLEKLLIQSMPEIAFELTGIRVKKTTTDSASFGEPKKEIEDTRRLGALEIDVDPSDTKVYVNKKYVGIDDTTLLNVPPGTYIVVGVWGAMRTVRRAEVFPGEETDVDIEMEPTYVEIDIEPDIAQVFINDKPYGRGDLDIYDIDPGVYSVKLKYRKIEYVREIEVFQGGEQEFDIEMPGYD